MNWLKWLLSIPFHLSMLVVIPLTLFLPFITLQEISQVIAYEVPAANSPFTVHAVFSFWFYLALRVPFLYRIYSKIPVLIPLLQMLLLTSVVLNTGLAFLNGWADQALYSKTTAIILMILSVISGRVLMSWWYTKNPLSESINRRTGEGGRFI